MAFDFKFDPATKDLIRDGKGSWLTTDTAETMLEHQLWCKFNAWWGDETLGSRLGDLRAFQVKPEVMIPDEAKRALGVLAARGRIANVEVAVDEQSPGRIVVETSCQDVSTGQPIATFTTAGGG